MPERSTPHQTHPVGLSRIGGFVFCLLMAVTSERPAFAGQPDAPDAAATRDYAVALGFQRKGLYPQAVERWTQFLQTHAKDRRVPNAHYHQGECYFQQKNYAQAAAKFRHVLGSYKDFAHRDAAQFNLGLVAFSVATDSGKADDFRKAAGEFAEVTKHYAQSEFAAQAGYYQGESLYRAGDAKGAVSAYQQTLTKHANDPLAAEVAFALGTTQQEQPDYAAAEATFKQFLTKHGKHALATEAKLRLGLSQLSLGKAGEAERLFRETSEVKDFPLADFAMLHHGQALFAREQFDEAARIFERLPERFKDSTHLPAAWLSAGKCRFREEDHDDARKDLERLLKDHPQAPEAAEATYWLAQSLRSLKKSPEAVKLIDAKLGQYAQSEWRPQLVFVRIEALADDPERKKEAVGLYAQFTRDFPQHERTADAMYRAALLALELADYAASRQHAEAFLARGDWKEHALRPDVLYIAGEGTLLGEPPDFGKAEGLYRQLIDNYREHAQRPAAVIRIGHCLVAAEKFDPAVSWLTQSLGGLKEKSHQAEAHFLIGRAHSAADRRPQAIAAFRQSRKADSKWPRGDEVLLALAADLHQQKDLDNAAKSLEELVSQYPQSPLRDRSLYRLGGLSAEREKWDDAASWYRRVVAEFKESPLAPAAQYGTGTVLYRKGDHASAVAELSKLLATWPKAEEVVPGRYLRGVCLHRTEKFTEAAADFTAYLATNPTDKVQAAEARFTLALCQSALEQHQPAIETLKKYLAESPDGSQADQALYELAFAHLALEQDGPAAEAFSQLVSRHAKSPLAAEGWYRLGEFREQQKQPAEAVKAYAAGLPLAQRPELRETLLYRLGRIEHAQEAYAQAAVHLQTQLKEFPKGSLAEDATHLAAECFYQQDKFAEALPLFEQSAKSSRKEYQARALYRAGHCATRLSRWADAEKAYEELLRHFPTEKEFSQAVEARYGLAFAEQNQRKFSEARANHGKVIDAADTETAAKSRFMLGEIDFAEQKFQAALEHYLEAALGYPYPEWQAQGLYQAGRCFVQLKQPDKARAELQTVVQKFPEHRLAKDAAKLLATLNGP